MITIISRLLKPYISNYFMAIQIIYVSLSQKLSTLDFDTEMLKQHTVVPLP